MTGMMPGPDGSAIPMEPTMLGDGDTLGDGISGPATEQSAQDPALNSGPMVAQSEAQIREQLVTDAYGTKLAGRQPVQGDNQKE